MFKLYGKNMWNFTARGLLIPNIDDIHDLFTCKETSTQSQRDTLDLKAEDIMLENNKNNLKIWNAHQDKYMIKLLNDGLNLLSGKCLKDMSDHESNVFLSTKEYKKQSSKFKLCIPNDNVPGKCHQSHDSCVANIIRK